jgi:hypothetical protein
MPTYFSDYFGLDASTLDDFGAFNVSLINDLPLFIDPFLLFNSNKTDYQKLHQGIIDYLIFLRDKASTETPTDAKLRLWYCFPEIKQNWLGFSITGNNGTGLGIDFARSLHKSLHLIFSSFGEEKVTKGSHMEKVCLIADKVGRDNISDFTTNLILDFLATYTEQFANKYLSDKQTRKVGLNRVSFNYKTESWESRTYRLPWINDDFVVLTPKDILTRDDTWINKGDLIHQFEEICQSLPDDQLRAEVDNYFYSVLTKYRKMDDDKEPSTKERETAATATILKFPPLLDYYIKLKEDTGDQAEDISSEKVAATAEHFVHEISTFQHLLQETHLFYQKGRSTYEETHERLAYLKDVIENRGGHKVFYNKGIPIQREQDLQILFRLVWFGTPSEVSAEANDGRGPVDYKISRGAKDKTLVEMKLAKNTSLERNLKNQVEIYKAASDAKNAIKVIIYFNEREKDRLDGILDKLGLLGHKDVVVIDARTDNKPSGSKA